MADNYTDASNLDVIIIGAGMSGLSAAKELRANGLKTLILESKTRIGGRAYTDKHTFGVSFDHGCAWLHSPEINDLKPIVLNLGCDTIQDNSSEIFMGCKKADESNSEKFSKAYEKIYEKIENEKNDISLDIVLNNFKDPFISMASNTIAFVAGVEINEVSIEALKAEASTENNDLVIGGLGSFVKKYGEDLPVILNTIVKKIDYSNKIIVIETNNGSFKANKVIITVPVGVLIKEEIEFNPKLPVKKLAAINGFKMGSFNKIGLMLNSKLINFQQNHYDLILDENKPTIAASLNYFDSGLAIVYTSGNLAKDLEIAGENASIDFALNNLIGLYGSNIKKAFIKGESTKWSQDPYCYGAYSAIKPGFSNLREHLSEPINEQLYFAGEACHTKWMTQLNGAYLTGKEVAKGILKDLNNKVN